MIGRLFAQKFSTKTDIPLKRIADLLKTGVENLQIKKNELFFQSALGKTYIRVTKNNLTTVDGSKIAGIVLIETKLPPELDKLDDSKISVLNAMAGFSALLREEQGMGCRIASRLTGYENNEESWNLYARLVASAAMFQSMWLISVIKGNAISSLNIGDSSQWTTVEFEHAADKLSSLGASGKCE